MTREEAKALLYAEDTEQQQQPQDVKKRITREEASVLLHAPSDSDILSSIGKAVLATPRVVGSTLAGLVAWPIQKSYGIMSLATGGTKEDALAAEEFVASKIPKFLQPKSDVEIAAVNTLGAAMEFALKPATMAGEQAEANWGARTGYVTSLIAELLMFKGFHKVGGAGRINVKQRATAKAVLQKKLKALTPEERKCINEIVKNEKAPTFKPRKKDQEAIEEAMREADPEKQTIETRLVKDAFEKEFVDKKDVELLKKKLPVKAKTPVKEVVEAKVEKKERRIKSSYADLDTPSIRTLNGKVYEGTTISKAWSPSKHTKIIRDEIRASYDVAREKARKAGEVLKIEEEKGGAVVNKYTKGFKTKDGYISNDVLAEKTKIVAKAAKAKAERIIKQGEKEIAYVSKTKKSVLTKKEQLGKLREPTYQDLDVFRQLVPTDIKKGSPTFGKEITHNNIAFKVVRSVKNKSILAKDFSYDILQNVARDAIWGYIRKVHVSDIDAFLSGKIQGKIKGTAHKVAENAIQNHIKKQLGLKQGKTRDRVAKELKTNAFREAAAYEEGKRTSVAEGKEQAIEDAHFGGEEAPRSGKSIRDKQEAKKQTNEEALAEVKETAGPVKKISVAEYKKQKAKENVVERIDNAAIEKFAGHRATLETKSKIGKTTREQRKLETDAIIATNKAVIRKNKQLSKKIKEVEEHPVTTEGGTTLYSGFPIHKAIKTYIKHTKGDAWKKLTGDIAPKLLDKLPYGIGKGINRALIYEYRGTLKDTSKFMKNMEDMNSHQAVGREYAINLGNRLQSLPEASQLKIAESIRGEMPKNLSKVEKLLAEESRDVFIALGKQATDLGLLNKKDFFAHVGKYMPRLYTKMEYKKLVRKYGEQVPDKMGLDRFKKRLDIDKEKRKALGEILTPGYPVAKGIIQLTHDIEMGKFFLKISENKDWTFNPSTKKTIPKGFRKLPINKRLGELSGKRVHPEIWEDITAVVHEQSKGERARAKMLAAWKFGKVVASPKTHARNMMSNAILAHLGGLPLYEQPYYLYKAAQQMKGRGEFWVAASKEGLMKSTFTHAELKAMFTEVELQLKGAKADSLSEKIGVIGSAWDKGKKGAAWAAKKYEAEEQWFKIAKFMHNVKKKKMSYKDAALDAEKWLFNYSKVTKAQHKYRTKWYGAPFATFTMKAMPRIAEAALTTPHRFLLPAAMIYGLEQAATSVIGDSPEQAKAKKEHRPDYMKSITDKIGLPSFPRVPFVDDNGREHYLSLSYILPWGDIAESGGFANILPGGISPMGMPIVSELAQQRTVKGFDWFTQKDIVPEEETVGKSKVDKLKTHIKYRAAHVAKTALPTPVIGAAKIISNLRGKPDYRGREQSTGLVLLNELLGLKVYPVNYTDQMVRAISKTHPKKGVMAGRIKRQIRTLHIKKAAMKKKGKSTKRYDDAIEKKINQIRGMAAEISKSAKSFNKIKGD